MDHKGYRCIPRTLYTVYYRSDIVLARFLKGRAVRMVWSQLEKEDGARTKQCLILSTDISTFRRTDHSRLWATLVD
jgi:hypothetical protein